MVGAWRNGQVVRRQGGSSSNFTRPLVGIANGGAYTNGDLVATDDKPAYRAFMRTTKVIPYDREKLMSWCLGR